jgi:hypothetical protein
MRARLWKTLGTIVDLVLAGMIGLEPLAAGSLGYGFVVRPRSGEDGK